MRTNLFKVWLSCVVICLLASVTLNAGDDKNHLNFNWKSDVYHIQKAVFTKGKLNVSGQDSDKKVEFKLDQDELLFTLVCERKGSDDVGEAFNKYRVPVAVEGRKTGSTVKTWQDNMNFCFDGTLSLTFKDGGTNSYVLNVAQFPTADHNIWLVGSVNADAGPKGDLITIQPTEQATGKNGGVIISIKATGDDKGSYTFDMSDYTKKKTPMAQM